MTDKSKNALDESALEGVAGGGFDIPYPEQPKRCSCGAYIDCETNADRVQ